VARCIPPGRIADKAAVWADAHEAYHAPTEESDHRSDLVNNEFARAAGDRVRLAVLSKPITPYGSPYEEARLAVIKEARAYLASGNWARKDDFE